MHDRSRVNGCEFLFGNGEFFDERVGSGSREDSATLFVLMVCVFSRGGCLKSPYRHPEHSEGSPESRYWRESLRCTQKDNKRERYFWDSFFCYCFLTADTSSIMGRRSSSCIPGMVSRRAASGSGSMSAVISKPFWMSPFT